MSPYTGDESAPCPDLQIGSGERSNNDSIFCNGIGILIHVFPYVIWLRNRDKTWMLFL